MYFMSNFIRPYYASQGYEFSRINESNVDGDRFYQLDHRYSVTRGFEDCISPVVIGSIYNVEVMTINENQHKKDNCSIALNELSSLSGLSLDEMRDEYFRIMEVIRDDIQNGTPHSSMEVLINVGDDVAMKLKPYYEFRRFINDMEDDLMKNKTHHLVYKHFFG